MKRHVTMAMIACVALGSLLALAPTVASAAPTDPACFPGEGTNSYPPTGPAVEPTLHLSLNDGLLLPSRTDGTLTVSGAVAGLDYCGTLFSAPVQIPVTKADSGGVLHFTGLHIPADFKLNAVHHLDVYRQAKLVGAFDFCVNSTGHLVAQGSCATKDAGSNGNKAAGSLPKTGWDHLVQILKVAAVAIALGVFLLYLRRRRAAGALQV